MKAWLTKALELLKASLEPPKHELNEMDWKARLSPDKNHASTIEAPLNSKLVHNRRSRDNTSPPRHRKKWLQVIE